MNKTDLRVIKTLRQIDDAVIQWMEQYPMNEMTVTLLCRMAMINKSTFYKYYQNLDDCVNRFLNGLMEEFTDAANGIFLLSPPTRIGDAVYRENFSRLARTLSARKRAYQAAWNARMDRSFYDEMMEALCAILQRTLEEESGAKAKEAYVQLFCRLLATQAMTMLRWWLNYEEEVSLDELLRLITENMRHGLLYSYRKNLG